MSLQLLKTGMLSPARDNSENMHTSSKDSIETSLVTKLMQLDRDVFAVAIFGFDGKLEAYVAKEFFAKEHRSEADVWEKAALRHAAVIKLSNEDLPETNWTTGIVFFRKEYKHILIPIPSRRIVIEAVMPLWNHSTVFFDNVHRYFEKK